MNPNFSRPTQDTKQEAGIVGDVGSHRNDDVWGYSPTPPTAAQRLVKAVGELIATVGGSVVVFLCFTLLRAFGQLEDAGRDGGQLLDRLVNDHW